MIAQLWDTYGGLYILYVKRAARQFNTISEYAISQSKMTVILQAISPYFCMALVLVLLLTTFVKHFCHCVHDLLNKREPSRRSVGYNGVLGLGSILCQLQRTHKSRSSWEGTSSVVLSFSYLCQIADKMFSIFIKQWHTHTHLFCFQGERLLPQPCEALLFTWLSPFNPTLSKLRISLTGTYGRTTLSRFTIHKSVSPMAKTLWVNELSCHKYIA